MMRSGAPVPPDSFIGNAVTVKPLGGSASRFATFSKIGMPAAPTSDIDNRSLEKKWLADLQLRELRGFQSASTVRSRCSLCRCQSPEPTTRLSCGRSENKQWIDEYLHLAMVQIACAVWMQTGKGQLRHRLLAKFLRSQILLSIGPELAEPYHQRRRCGVSSAPAC
jgi:hypothetical protein